MCLKCQVPVSLCNKAYPCSARPVYLCPGGTVRGQREASGCQRLGGAVLVLGVVASSPARQQSRCKERGRGPAHTVLC